MTAMDVSFKAVLFDEHDRVLLGSNPRSEWELLGGRADDEDAGPVETIIRELWEEAGIHVDVGELIDIWYYDIANEGRVAVVSYLATTSDITSVAASVEHGSLGFFGLDDLDALVMPAEYKRTIRTAAELRQSHRTKEKK